LWPHGKVELNKWRWSVDASHSPIFAGNETTQNQPFQTLQNNQTDIVEGTWNFNDVCMPRNLIIGTNYQVGYFSWCK
jgi:hypothetical protein